MYEARRRLKSFLPLGTVTITLYNPSRKFLCYSATQLLQGAPQTLLQTAFRKFVLQKTIHRFERFFFTQMNQLLVNFFEILSYLLHGNDASWNWSSNMVASTTAFWEDSKDPGFCPVRCDDLDVFMSLLIFPVMDSLDLNLSTSPFCYFYFKQLLLSHIL